VTRTRFITSPLALLVALVTVLLATPPAPAATRLPFGMSAFATVRGVYSSDDAGRALRDIKSGSLLRYSVEWESIQPGLTSGGTPCPEWATPETCVQPGPMSFSRLDSEISRLSQYGIRLILVPNAAPPFARSLDDRPSSLSSSQRPNGYVVPPANSPVALASWQGFVAALVQHVTTTFPGIVAGVEIWNEPNGQVFWTTQTGPDPERYTAVLCSGYNGVRAVSSTLPVIFGSTFPSTAQLPEAMSVPQFVTRAYRAGARGCLNALGIHPYPTLDSDPLRAFSLAMRQIRSAAAASGDAGRKLSITEIGLWGDAREQASFLVKSYRMAEGMSDVNMYLVHTLFEYRGSWGMGVCAAPRKARAAANSLKRELTGSIRPATC
jgi:hypothetical protein